MQSNFRICASVHFMDVRCPKHHNDMIELKKGFVDVVWWCKECECIYEMGLSKMRKFNRDAVDKQLSHLENK